MTTRNALPLPVLIKFFFQTKMAAAPNPRRILLEYQIKQQEIYLLVETDLNKKLQIIDNLLNLYTELLQVLQAPVNQGYQPPPPPPPPAPPAALA